AVNFGDRLAQYLQTLPATDPNFRTLSDSVAQLRNLNLVSQSLSGLGSRLMMRWQTLQLPLISLQPVSGGAYRDDDVLAAGGAAGGDAVPGAGGRGVTDDRPPPAPARDDGESSPVGAGPLTVTRLALIDGFGQMKDIADSGATRPNPLFPVLAEGVRTPGDPTRQTVQLAPRLAQPARLAFRLMSAADPTDTVQTNSAPSTSPVCGWL